ncbi:efflux RND transporter periplasmic adaptor subunit [Myxococcota bacterium]|nr:efflux RND transporter periplasmic adaptor subunit [Myxococcota bacterium]
MKTKTKITIGTIVGLILVVGAVAGTKGAQIGAMIDAGKSFVPPPEAVTSAKVERVKWSRTTGSVGTLVPLRGVTLGAEIPGTVRKLSFDLGDQVRAGQVLVQLDTSTEEAQLAAAEADAALARSTLERVQSLVKSGSGTAADLDAAEARQKAAEAGVATLRATIAKKTIRAPFDGRASIRQVELGQVVSPGSLLVTLASVHPILAELSLPQQALADLRVGQAVRVRSDVFPNETWEGKLSLINTEVDVATRNVRVRAEVPNKDGRLRPGMFVTVDVVSGEESEVLVIPSTAVIYAPYGDSVFVIEEKKDAAGKPTLTVRQQFVRLGERRGDYVAVLSGLEGTETIAGTGAFKLRNGATVVLNDKLAPESNVAPKPTEE